MRRVSPPAAATRISSSIRAPMSSSSSRSATAPPATSVDYPDDDLAAKLGPDGKWHYFRKDGTPY